MNTILQILIKVVLTFSVLLISGLAIRSLWQTSFDLRKIVNPMTWFEKSGDDGWSFIPSRKPDKIYVQGVPVATVSGAEIDTKLKTISFQRASGPHNWTVNLPGPDGRGIPPQFEYLDFVIEFRTCKNMVGAGLDQMFGDATFEIIRRRNAF